MKINSSFSNLDILKLRGIIDRSRHIVVCAHRGPDGDALGSSLALAEVLRAVGKDVRVVLPNAFPDFLRWMPGSRDVAVYEGNECELDTVIAKADLICMLDFCEPGRLQNLADPIMSSRATRIMIDHHLNPDMTAASLVLSNPSASSTCELVFQVIGFLGLEKYISRNVAACIYTGMMTDTGGFTYNSARPEIYYIIGELLRRRIDKDRIYRKVYHNYSPSRLRFIGYVLNEKTAFYEKNRASVMTITREELQRFHYIRGDAEGLVNMPLQVRGMRLVISLREDTEKDVIRVSLRSVDDFPCNEMAAAFFNGGGHLNASGGELPFPMEEAVRTAEKAIEAFKDKL